MNPRQTALLWAVLFLRDRKLRADPKLLIGFVDDWIKAFAMHGYEMPYETARDCGISAARECAMPCWSPGVTLIEPTDLLD